MKIILKSDFIDFYDHQFDVNTGSEDFIVFNRFSKSGMNREQMFKFFRENNIRTPEFGKVKEFALNDKLIVYTDIDAHCGEGKILINSKEDYEKYKDSFCVEYIEGTNNESYRLLKIGYRHFWLKYKSEDNWQSNVGDVEIKVLAELKHPLFEKIGVEYPLLGIDYIFKEFEMLAVDYNISPGLKFSGIEKYMSPNDIYNDIKEYIVCRNNNSFILPDIFLS